MDANLLKGASTLLFEFLLHYYYNICSNRFELRISFNFDFLENLRVKNQRKYDFLQNVKRVISKQKLT